MKNCLLVGFFGLERYSSVELKRGKSKSVDGCKNRTKKVYNPIVLNMGGIL